MDISEFIKETIRQVCDGITRASRDCSQSGVIVNPAISVGENGDFYIPKKPSSIAMQRRVQKIDFDIGLGKRVDKIDATPSIFVNGEAVTIDDDAKNQLTDKIDAVLREIEPETKE